MVFIRIVSYSVLKHIISVSLMCLIVSTTTYAIQVEECGYIFLDKNYAFVDEEVKGALHLLRCSSTLGTSLISVGIFSRNDVQISKTNIKNTSLVEPFSLKIPIDIEEGMYKMVAYTPFNNRILYSMDFPVFTTSNLDYSPSLSVNEEKKASDKIVSNSNKMLEVIVKSNKKNSLTIQFVKDFKESHQYLSVKMVDKAQSFTEFSKQTVSSFYYLSGTSSTVKSSIKTSTFSLKGRLINSNDEICSYCTVFITIPSSEKGINYSKTNDKGYFEITGLDNPERTKAYVSYLNEIDSDNYEFEIYENTPSLDIRGSEINFDSLKSKMHNSIVRKHLARKFNSPKSSSKKTTRKLQDKPFESIKLYPNFDEQVLFDKYFVLEDMKKSLKVIVPDVNFFKKTEIRILPDRSKVFFPEEPLILLDGIPVKSSTVLSLDPKTVHKVEVLNKISTLAKVGNIARFGILSIFTKNGLDESKLDNIKKVYLDGFRKQDSLENDSNLVQVGESFLPHSVFWIPNIVFNGNKSKKIEIPLPEYSTDKILSVRGFDDKGNFIFLDREIE